MGCGKKRSREDNSDPADLRTSKPTEGSYSYGRNSERDDLNGVRRRMGAVVETPSIYGHLTAEDNLKEQYRILGKPRSMGYRNLSW